MRLLMESVSHLGKKQLLPGLFDERDMKNLQRNDCWTCLKVRWSFGVPDSWKSQLDILQDTDESEFKTDKLGGTVFEISFFMEKYARHYRHVG